MSKIDALVLQTAELFGQSAEYTQDMVDLHGVVLPLPKCRYPGDGLDSFYSDMTAFRSTEPSLTKQEFTQSCDPNFVIDRVLRGQDISAFMTTRQPVYGDFTAAPASYHDAMNTIASAQQQFMLLDPELRKKFDNEVPKYLDFIADKANFDDCVKMGIFKPKSDTSSAEAASRASVTEGGGEGA